MRHLLDLITVVVLSAILLHTVGVSADGGGKQQKIQYVQDVHQYLVQQAYQLLRTQYPLAQNTQMNNHIGSWEGAGPWTTGLVAAGAWREDEEDVVYGVGGPFNGWTPTATHFWNADAGDGSKFSPPDIVGRDIENAYQKARVLIYGSDIWGNHRIFFYQSTAWPQFGVYQSLGWYMSYESLFELYRTGEYYWDGWIDVAGYNHYTHYGPYYMSQNARDICVWEILGRVCHLLGDMTVPAHVHNDPHADRFPINDPDLYENGMPVSYCQQWTAATALSAGGLINASGKYDPLRYLFYTANQVADHFPSDDVSGDNFFAATYGSDSYTELQTIMQGLGAPPPSVNIFEIASTSFVTGIRCIAGLLHWFALETELAHTITLNPPTYIEPGSGGGYRINGGQTVTSWSSTVAPGTVVNLEAVPPAGWLFVEWSDNGQDKHTNPRELSRNADVTLYAKFKKRFGSTLASATGPSNQRKLTRDFDGVYHLLYPSGGYLWYTKSTDAGTSWLAESSAGQGGIAGNPSSASSSLYSADLFTVWQETDAQSVRHLYLRRQYSPTNVYVDELDNTSSLPDMQPSVGVSADGGFILVMYKKMLAGSSRVFYRFSWDGGFTFDGPTALFVGTPIIWDYPSIAWNTTKEAFVIACTTPGGNVNYLTYDADTWHSGSVAYAVPGLSGSAQVAVDGTGREYFTWIGTGCYEAAGCVKSRSLSGTWSATTEINTDLAPPMQHSSVSGNASSSGGGVLICTDMCVELTFRTLNGTSWQCAQHANWPYYPSGTSSTNLLEKFTAPAVASVITINQTSPYQIVFETRDFRSEGLQKVSSSEEVTAASSTETVRATIYPARRIEYRDTTTGGTLDILLEGLTLSRAGVREELSYREVGDEARWLTSSEFSLSSAGNVLEGSLRIRANNWARSDFTYALELVDTTSGGASLISAVTRDTFSASEKESTLTYSICRTLPTLLKEALVRVRLEGLPKDGIITERYDVLTARDTSSRKKEELPLTQTAMHEPTAFMLSDAYPTPFNPSTTLNYALPSPGRVSLKVYDVLGREVASLVDGYVESGYHKAPWNAGGISSGAYYARFTVTDEFGNVKFMKVNKLLLMK